MEWTGIIWILPQSTGAFKMKIIYLLIFVIISSCCLTKVNHNDLEDIKTDMAHINNVILGKIRANKEPIRLNQLDSMSYLDLIQKYKQDSDKEFVEFYKRYDPEVVFKSSTKDFGMCLRSKAAKVFLCDDAFTGSIDIPISDIRNTSFDLEQKLSELQLAR